jgi:hypothetical protein
MDGTGKPRRALDIYGQRAGKAQTEVEYGARVVSTHTCLHSLAKLRDTSFDMNKDPKGGNAT